MTPLISIIVPVYNAGSCFHNCINSILDQTFTNWEVILVDDGSTDGSSDVCDYYAKKDSRIKVIHTINRGVQAARNTGLDNVKGEFVTFVDADDTLESNTLKECIEIFETNESIDIVQFQEYLIDQNNEKKKRQNSPTSDIILTSNLDFAKAFLEKDLILTGMLWGKIYRSNLFDNYRFQDDITFSEDTYSLPDILVRCNKIMISFKGGYNYIYNYQSVTRSEFTAKKSLDLSLMKVKLLKYAMNNLQNKSLIADYFVDALKSSISAYCMGGPNRNLIANLNFLNNMDFDNIENEDWKYKLSKFTTPLFTAKITRCLYLIRKSLDVCFKHKKFF